jgi:hypothetical protein
MAPLFSIEFLMQNKCTSLWARIDPVPALTGLPAFGWMVTPHIIRDDKKCEMVKFDPSIFLVLYCSFF